MTGIAGIFNLDGQVESAHRLRVMGVRLEHRGGHERFWQGCGVGLVQRSTAVRCTAGAGLPELGNAVVTADARVDNDRELCRALGLDWHDRPAADDLILAAYRRWGVECVDRIIGDFAFAVWDADRQQLFCARDPMGVKPFYFVNTSTVFAFASEIKALLQLEEVSEELSDAQIASFIEGREPDRESTLFTAISRLPAASWMCVSRSRSVTRTYWRPDPHREIRFSSDGEYVESFREIFAEAVSTRLQGHDSVGATLSGGLDSSAVTCVARRLIRARGATPLHTFSLVFPSLPSSEQRLIDERDYIESVLRGGDVVPHMIPGDAGSPLGQVDAVLDALDQPSGAPNLYLHWAMYQAAGHAGVGALLDGFDGDTAVSHGFGRLDDLARSGDWATFEAEVRAYADRRGMAAGSVVGHFGVPRLAELSRRGRWLSWYRSARQLVRRFRLSRRQLLIQHGIIPLLPSGFRGGWPRAKGVGSGSASLLNRRSSGRLPPLRASAHLRPEHGQSERLAHAEGMASPLYQRTLEIADHAACAFGVEPRYPFFDRRLLEFCLAVPPEQKFAQGWPRYLFRRAMEGWLPPDVQWRKNKANLSPSFRRGLLKSDRATVERCLQNCGPLAHFIDKRAFRDVWTRYVDTGDAAGRNPDGLVVVRVAELARWLERTSERRAAHGKRLMHSA